MVAYSFNRKFVPAIESGLKSQTIRAHRRRHARPGERLQLYTGMRTKACKLIRDDVVCSRLDEVRFDLRALAGEPIPKNSRQLGELIALVSLPLEINHMELPAYELDSFARSDGFRDWVIKGDETNGLRPFAAMVMFWWREHGPRLFEGVMISWEKRP